MLFPDSHPWTLRQRWLIAGIVVAGLVAFSALVYGYERYYRGPDDSVFVGAWQGEIDGIGDIGIGFRFKPDHTYQGGWAEPGGHWQAGGEFLYLRQHWDDPSVSVPYDTLEVWHIDSMTQTELRMHDGEWRLHAVVKRVE